MARLAVDGFEQILILLLFPVEIVDFRLMQREKLLLGLHGCGFRLLSQLLSGFLDLDIGRKLASPILPVDGSAEAVRNEKIREFRRSPGPVRYPGSERKRMFTTPCAVRVETRPVGPDGLPED